MGTGPAPPNLIGRAREQRALAELLDAVRGGHSRVLVVRGESGIGKTALLQHVIAEASGFTVMHASGVESEMELPFAALHQLCAPMLDHLDELPDPQRDAARAAFGMAVDRSPDRLLIGLAVLSLVAAASNDAPLLCIIDDAHWLDLESAQALAFVARRLLAERVGVLFGIRRSHAGFEALPELRLEGLHDSDAQTLLSSVLHVPLDERIRARIVAETNGNPLALVEWPQGLTRAELAGGFGLPTSLPMRGQIEESFRRRVVELPPRARQFLTLAAAEPTGDPVILWRAASELGIVAPDAAPAVDAGLIEIGVRVRFRHPLVRSAAYASATTADRQAAHRALAQVTDGDADPDRRAWHRALGSPGPDEEIAEELELSAVRARARGGFAAAGALLERSVALTFDPAHRAPRVLGAAEAHLEAGSFAVANSLLTSTESTPRNEMEQAQWDLLRARLAVFGGDPGTAPELLLRTAQYLEHIDVDLASSLYLQAFVAVALVGSFSRGVVMEDVARAAIACLETHGSVAHEWLVRGLAQVTVDGPGAAVPSLRRALDMPLTDTFGTPTFQLLGHQLCAATTLWDVDAFQRIAILQVAASRDVGALSQLPGALNVLAQAHLLTGNLDAASSSIAEAREIYDATGSNLLPSVAALLVGLRGNDSDAHVIDEQAAKARNAGLGLALKSAEWAAAILHNGSGRYEQGLAAATRALQEPWHFNGQLFFHEHIEAATRCGQFDVAAATLERLRDAVEGSGSDWGIGIQRRCQALLADNSVADALFGEAVDCLARTPIRPELARTHLLYGEWLRRGNRRVDAREQLRTAHEMFLEMGIHGFAERARHELLATGETVRKRAVDTFDELTPQEAHIANLAADGRTNSEIGALLFISPRTVEWHLRKVFSKLGVTSRRELREALPRYAGHGSHA